MSFVRRVPGHPAQQRGLRIVLSPAPDVGERPAAMPARYPFAGSRQVTPSGGYGKTRQDLDVATAICPENQPLARAGVGICQVGQHKHVGEPHFETTGLRRRCGQRSAQCAVHAGGQHRWSPGYPGATRVPPRPAAYQRRGWHCPRSDTRGLIKPCQVGVGAAETTPPRCVPVRGLLRSDCAGCCSHPGGILGGQTCRGPASGGRLPPPRPCATRLRHPRLAPPSHAGWPRPARRPAPHGGQCGAQAAGWKA